MAGRAEIDETIASFLTRVGKLTELNPDTLLFADGIELDSLETAELAALLEDMHGADPFNAAEMPQTVGDIYDFFGASAP